jgi:protein-S-isoprenylcysteine O-methyltransferase Ste14
MTFGLTLTALDTRPVLFFCIGDLNGYSLIFLVWVGEVFSYIVLGRIEEIALKAKYRDQFLEYASKVSFMIPYIKLNRDEIKKNNR